MKQNEHLSSFTLASGIVIGSETEEIWQFTDNEKASGNEPPCF